MSGLVAIIVIHGIGEQVPMATLASFVESTWTKDLSLVSPGKPHPDTGATQRTSNAAWYKPDPRTRNFDLRLITTETYETASKAKKRADFFEFYWAHRVTGTPWQQVRAWLFGLMLRNPFTKVPPPLRLAWAMMWLLALTCVAAIYGIPLLLAGRPFVSAIVLAILAAVSAGVVKALNDRVGDIVRYVDPSPGNIKTRQEIREDGVRLLETLLGVDEDGRFTRSRYDRVMVVGHSLGTIVGYDILNHTFGRLNLIFDRLRLAESGQEELTKLETLVRKAWDEGKPLDPNLYQAHQQAAREELNAAGNPWIVSDFISIGSPLTHAEFLMASDRDHLAQLQATRVYPTCPPQLEYHSARPNFHFTYPATKGLGAGSVSLKGKRVPHHGATFAFTRWTNIYSQVRGISGGDIVSGRLCDAFGLATRMPQADEPQAQSVERRSKICGIREISVLPSDEGTSEDRKLRRLTHQQYWDMTIAATGEPGQVPYHIQALRDALDLKEKRGSASADGAIT